MALITAYWGLDGMIVLTTLIITVYLYMTRKFNYWKKRGVIEVPPMPFFGNFLECTFLKKSPGMFMEELYEQGKGLPYIGFYILDTPALMIRDREHVKNVLIKDFNNFCDRYSSADPHDRLGYANVFFLRNPAWKLLRAKLTPFFTSGKLKQMFGLMLEASKNLDTCLESLKLEGKGMDIEVRDLTGKFSTDIIGNVAFGLSVNSLNDPNDQFRIYGKKIFEVSLFRAYELFSMFFFPNLVRIAGFKTFGKEASDFLRNVIWETLTQRMKSGQKRNDLIDILVELKKSYADQEFGDFKFDGDDLVAQAASFFSAGYETSSSTTTFTLHSLATHPEVQKKLRKEILDALNETDGKITYDMLSSLPYLDMVVSESLRMYPALPFLDRQAVDTYKVPNSDLVLEKGTPVYISVTGTHYDPEYYPDPHKFDPERFNEENKRNRPSCMYFPFGDGPHNCIGFRLGLLQTKLGLVTFLKKYEVAPCEKTLIPMVLDHRAFLTVPLNGTVYLNIRKISVN